MYEKGIWLSSAYLSHQQWEIIISPKINYIDEGNCYEKTIFPKTGDWHILAINRQK